MARGVWIEPEEYLKDLEGSNGAAAPAATTATVEAPRAERGAWIEAADYLKSIGVEPAPPAVEEPGTFTRAAQAITENIGRAATAVFGARVDPRIPETGAEDLTVAGKPEVQPIKGRLPVAAPAKPGELEMPDLTGTEFERPEAPEEGKPSIPFGGRYVMAPSRKKKGEMELRKEYNIVEESVRAWTRGSLELAESIPGTGVRALGTALEYVAPHTGAEIQQLGKDVEKFWGRYAKEYEGGADIEGAIVEEPSLLANPKWWTAGVFNMLPSLVASMVPGMGAGRAIEIGGKMFGWTPKLVEKLAHLGAAITGGAAGGSIEGAQTYRTVIERGGTEQEALRAGTLMALASGALNAISLERLLPKGAAARLSEGAVSRLGRLKKMLVAGGIEGFTEWMEEPAEALILGDPVLDSILQGANVLPIAFLTGGLVSGASQVRIGKDRAPASFVGYDQTAAGPMPIFVLDQDLGEAKQGTMVTAAALAEAGFVLPKYPRPKSGEKLFPDESEIEAPGEAEAKPAEEPEAAKGPVLDEILDELAGKGGIPVEGEAPAPGVPAAAAEPAAPPEPGKAEVEVPVEPEKPKAAPVRWLGWQEIPGKEPVPFWNLTEDIQGHPKGSTMTPRGLKEAGYEAPEPPVAAPKPTPAPAPKAAPGPAQKPTAAVTAKVMAGTKQVTVAFPSLELRRLFTLPRQVKLNPERTKNLLALSARELGIDPGEVQALADRYRQDVFARAKAGGGADVTASTLEELRGEVPAAAGPIEGDLRGGKVEPTVPMREREQGIQRRIAELEAMGKDLTEAGRAELEHQKWLLTNRTPAEVAEVAPVSPQAAPPAAAPSGGVPTLSPAEQAARERLKRRFETQAMATGGPDPEQAILRDLMVYGTAIYQSDPSLQEFDAWAALLKADLGDAVEEYLPDAFMMIRDSLGEGVETEGGEEGGQGGRAGALEGAPAEDVRGPEAVGAPGGEPEPGGGPDLGGDGRGGEQGDRPEPGVGGAEGGVGLPAGGEPGAELGGRPGAPGAPTGAAPAGEPGPAPVGVPGAPEPIHADPTAKGRNFRISEALGIGRGTAKEKYQDNLAAIRLLKDLEAEQRPATEKEQEVLARYVGWGGLPEVFDKNASWQRAHPWRKEFEEIRGLLTEEEYVDARASTLNAHYTSIPVVRAMWATLRRMGFDGGRMLEPGSGIGNFLGTVPGEIADRTAFTAVELDSITGRILKALYPESNVHVTGFEKMVLPNNFFDVAMGNVPFGEGISDTSPQGKQYAKQGLTARIHDYFFAKSLDKVRPGGVLAFITSTGTLDKKKPGVRIWLAQRAEFIGAVRLPAQTFKENARTEVTTDIVFLKKRATPISKEMAALEAWTQIGLMPLAGRGDYRLNRYYLDNPQAVLGTLSPDRLKPGRLGVETPEGYDLPGELEKALARLPGGIITKRSHAATDLSNENTRDQILPAAGVAKPGGYVSKDGKIYINRGEMRDGNPVLSPTLIQGQQAERITSLLRIRDAARDVLRVQMTQGTEEEIRATQKELGRLYDEHLETFKTPLEKGQKAAGVGVFTRPGYLHSKENGRAMPSDPDWPFILYLEKWNSEDQVATKADIFTEPVVVIRPRPTSSPNAKGAMLVALNEFGDLTEAAWTRMGELTGKTFDDLVQELKGLIFLNPEGGYEVAEDYLSGNVRHKLAVARAAQEQEPGKWDDNVQALEAAMPADIPPEKIRAMLGASWIPAESIQAFVADLLGVSRTRVVASHIEPLAAWIVKVDGAETFKGYAATSEWGTSRVNFVKLLNLALHLKAPVVYDKFEDGGRAVNVTETEAAREKQRQVMERFEKWVWENPERSAELQRLYNERYNSEKEWQANGEHLALDGMNPAVILRPHQKNSIWRIERKGNTLLAHIVGSGKTFIMVGAAIDSRRLGLANKPMIAVPNHMVPQVTQDAFKMYPAANILAMRKGDLAKDRRAEFMAKIATGNWDLIIMPHSAFGKLPVSNETYTSFMNEKLDELRSYLDILRAQDGPNAPSVKQIEAAIARLELKIAKRAAKGEKDVGVTWEELGVDMLMVDEAHYYKNLYFPTRMTNVAGLASAESDRAFDLYMKTQYLTRINNGRGVVFATGTPISNTLGETYVMLSYLMGPKLREMGLAHFDSWAGTFTRRDTSAELTVAGQYRPRTRLKFSNIQELVSLFRQVADVQMDSEAIGLVLPRIKGSPDWDAEAIRDAAFGSLPPTKHLKDAQVVLSRVSREQLEYMQDLIARVEEIKAGNVDPHDDNMLKVTGDGRKNSLDARLVNPGAPENPQGKINKAAENIYRIWKRDAKNPTTQLVFLDLATPKASAKKPRVGKNEPWMTPFEKWAATLKLDLGSPAVRTQAMSVYGRAILDSIAEGEEPSEKVMASLDQPWRGLAEAGLRQQKEAEEEGAPTAEGLPEEDVPELEQEKRDREQMYGELKRKLIERGIPAKEIAFIHDAKNPQEKQDLFDAVNRGSIRIFMGSTDKMGVGTNIQRLVSAGHDIDAPWRPDYILQRHGRFIRQGNLNAEVEIFIYISEGQGGRPSFDAFMWQLLEAKNEFFLQLLKGEITERDAEDPDLALDANLYKGYATGDERIVEKVNLEMELRRLEMLKKHHEEDQERARQESINLPRRIAEIENELDGYTKDLALYEANKDKPFSLTLNGVVYTERAKADEALLIYEAALVAGKFTGYVWRDVGEFRGFTLQSRTMPSVLKAGGVAFSEFQLRGAADHQLSAETVSPVGSAEGVLRNMATRALTRTNELSKQKAELVKYQDVIGKPFEHDPRIAKIRTRLAELNAALGIAEAPKPGPIFIDEEPEDGEDEGGQIQRMFTGRPGGGQAGAGKAYSSRGILSGPRRGPPTGAQGRISGGPPGPAAAPTAPGAPPTAPAGPAPYVDLKRKDVLIQEMSEVMRRANAGGLTLQGGLRGPAGLHGQRHPLTGNIRMRRITDIDTAAHEFGHGLQHALKISLSDLLGFKAEMRAMQQLQQVRGPRMTEGFAEFVRVWVTDPVTAARLAPRFTPWFEARLSTEPDLEAGLKAMREGILALRAAPPVERAAAGIAFPKPAPRPSVFQAARAARDFFRNAWRSIRFHHADKGLPVREIEEILGGGRLLFGGQSPYKKFRTASPRAFAVGHRFVFRGIVDYRTNAVIPGTRSLADILEPIWKRSEQYQTYEVLRRIQFLEESPREQHRSAAAHLRNLMEQGQRWSPQDTLGQTVMDLDAQHPDFAGVLDELQTWNNGLLQYMADSGNYSQEAIDAIREANLLYVPLHRLMDEEVGSELIGEGIGERVVGVERTIKAIRGRSERIILPTIKERYKQAFQMISAAERNDVAATLARHLSGPLAKDKNLGVWMEKIPMPLQATTFQLDRVRKVLIEAMQSAGYTPQAISDFLSTVDLSILATIFHPSPSLLKPNQVMIWRDGKPEVWEVFDGFLLRSLTQIDKHQVEAFLKGYMPVFRLMRGMARLLRGGVIFHPTFLTRNLLRDQQEALVQGRGLLPPYIKGIIDAFQGGEVAERYAMGGGLLFNVAKMESKAVERVLREAIEGKWYRGNILRTGMGKVEDFTEWFEMPTRVGVAKTVSETLTPAERAESPRDINIELSYQGREASTDFGMTGAAPGFQALAMTTAFLRPFVNGIYRSSRFLQAAARNPAGPEMRRLAIAGSLMILAEALLYWNNRDDPRWKDFPDEDKTNYWIFILNAMTPGEWAALSPAEKVAQGDNVIRIPRGYVFGTLFGALPRSIFESISARDPEAFTRFMVNSGLVSLSQVIPTALRGGIEVGINKSLYFGTPVVSKRFEDRPRPEQYGRFTSEVAKAVGQTTGQSPMVIDYLVRAYLGTIGQEALNVADAVLDLTESTRPPQPAWKASDYPVLRTFFQRYPSLRSRPIEEFYAFYKETRGAKQDYDAKRRQGDTVGAKRVWDRDKFEILWAGRIAREATRFAATRAQMDRIYARPLPPGMNEREEQIRKREELDTIAIRELDRARRVMQDVREARRKPLPLLIEQPDEMLAED